MKHLVYYFDYLNESVEKSTDMILDIGHTLFHSTLEEFDAQAIRGGGYDNIIWTAEDSAISQSYIAVSSSILISTKSIAQPNKDKEIQGLQVSMGIVYDYSTVKFDLHGGASGYANPKVFAGAVEQHYAALQSLVAAEKEYTDRFNYYSGDDRDVDNEENDDELFALLLKAERNKKAAKALYSNTNADKFKFEYVNTRLSEMCYKPKREDDFLLNHMWDLKSAGGKIVNSDYRASGRLLILKAKESVRIYDYVGDSEGDLTDLDYHKIDLFRRVEADGYDGIRINDFAQFEEHGNIGHVSFGIFPGSISKFHIQALNDVKHPTPKEFSDRYDSLDTKSKWHSPEYLKYLKNI